MGGGARPPKKRNLSIAARKTLVRKAEGPRESGEVVNAQRVSHCGVFCSPETDRGGGGGGVGSLNDQGGRSWCGPF